MSNPECVKVAVRIRPMTSSESIRGCQSVVEISPPDEPQVVICGGNKPSDIFTYNYAFAPEASQEQLYENVVSQMLDKLFAGFNVTILAYGQTGSGKTYTMGTDFAGDMGDRIGVIPRAIVDIFEKVEQARDIRTSCSFVELYQENVYDLLSVKDGPERQTLDIREGPGGVVLLQGLTEINVTSVRETFDCLVRGAAGRIVRATAMNAVSSRSHSIFTITLQQPSADDPTALLTSKFQLVDLAGSERSKKTKTTGDGFREGVKINQGLLALGNVISALGTSVAAGSNSHVPYRDSKLTRMLQDSLGGNSYTLMIACVSPADYNLNETISTLRYADRVRKIKNKPIVNQDPHLVKIKQLEGVIQDLRVEILLLKGGEVGAEFRVPKAPPAVRPSNVAGLPPKRPFQRSSSSGNLLSAAGGGADVAAVKNGKRKSATQELQDKNRLLQAQLQAMAQDLATNEIRALAAEKTLDMLDEKIDDEEGIRQHIGSVLSSYRDEMIALGVLSAAEGDTRGSRAPSVIGTASHETSAVPLTEDGQKRSESHTTQQINFHNQLRQLNMELALKEELHRRCMGNSAAVSSAGGQPLTEVLADYQQTIVDLEQQLAELNGQLENTKASEKKSKLSEERRKKVQQLEAELTELRSRSVRQAKLLKLKEKDAQRIQSLSTEIQTMKGTRVKLLKSMRAESENFRKWRLTHEKEICQLKAKDRKRQNELQSMETMHEKQQKIMKRKLDETAAVNKRLKAALDRRMQRNGSKLGGDRTKLRGTEAARWIEQELELLYSMVEASVTLDVLMERRTQLTAKLAHWRSAGSDPSQADEIRQCEDELDSRNAQIKDLQQRGHDFEVQLEALSGTIETLPEKKEAFRRVLAASVADRKQLTGLRFQLEECQTANDCLEETLAQLRADRQQAEQRYAVELAEFERTYEDKLALLLLQQQQQLRAAAGQNPPSGEASTTSTSSTNNVIVDQMLERIETLRDELELYKESNRKLKTQLIAAREIASAYNIPRVGGGRKKPKAKPIVDAAAAVIDYEEDDEETEFEDDGAEDFDRERDPDFRGTPIHKRKKPNVVLEQSKLAANDTTTTSSTNETVNSSSQPHCSCRSNCSTLRCGCKKSGISCQAGSCRCVAAKCANKPLDMIDGSQDSPPDDVDDGAAVDDKENTFVANTTTTIQQRSTRDTMLLEKLSTPQRVQIGDEMDILTYVATHRKRKPLLDD
ncbi:chromosome-associated kinesin KIF4A-like [Anopheles cruzii]|uniref:chromosome-associated kinesin KIF4A-like n=1 Tax=Anopheles cruzii TaxID=68878 RepID=UPI0022EC8219|nr:chromosome-associated kinesin KIF4A-like [Anopheles cruzii]